eukprot:scaffold94905_cov36-Cyclotella_meneghiniana.AAC.12
MKFTITYNLLTVLLYTVSALSNDHHDNYDSESTFLGGLPGDDDYYYDYDDDWYVKSVFMVNKASIRNDREMKNKSNLRGKNAEEALVSVNSNCQCEYLCCGPGYSDCVNQCNGYAGDDDWLVKFVPIVKEEASIHNDRGQESHEALVSVSRSSNSFSSCNNSCNLIYSRGAGYSNCVNRCNGLRDDDYYFYDDDDDWYVKSAPVVNKERK